MNLRSLRLGSQRLEGAQLKTPEMAAAWLGGVQAQDYRGGKWSIGLRTEGVRAEAVEQAVADHRIVRTWMFRGTLHFIAAPDLGWLTGLLGPEIKRGNARRYAQLELGPAAFRKSQSAIRKAIEADGPLTRPELKTRFETEGVPAEGQQVPYLLQRAALDGLICSGTMRGGEPIYGLVSDWVGTQEALERDAALGRLAALYFESRGPATEGDFAWWAGLRMADARRAIAAADGIEPVEIEGVDYLQKGPGSASGTGDPVHLLPAFDEYLLSYKDRSGVLDPAFSKRINRGGGILKPAVIREGEVVGTWSRAERRGALEIEIEPFHALAAGDRGAVERAAARLGEFESTPVGAIRWIGR